MATGKRKNETKRKKGRGEKEGEALLGFNDPSGSMLGARDNGRHGARKKKKKGKGEGTPPKTTQERKEGKRGRRKQTVPLSLMNISIWFGF